MIKRLTLKEFKRFRDASVPLQPLTVLVGANGSGKSSVLEAVSILADPARMQVQKVLGGRQDFEISAEMDQPPTWIKVRFDVGRGGFWHDQEGLVPPAVRLVNLDPAILKRDHPINQAFDLPFPAWLDKLRYDNPDAFDLALADLQEVEPQIKRILTGPGESGKRRLSFEYRDGTRVDAEDASDGTLLGLAIFALGRAAEPGSIMLLEEPDRGLHPRMLSVLFDHLMRLAYPRKGGVAVQIIATTHSPTFLDLFKDYPECIVIVEKGPVESTLVALGEAPDLIEKFDLRGSPLGEFWLSGALGGVPDPIPL